MESRLAVTILQAFIGHACGIVDNIKLVGFAAYGRFRAWPLYKYTIEQSCIYIPLTGNKESLTSYQVYLLNLYSKTGIYHNAGIDADIKANINLYQKLVFPATRIFKQVLNLIMLLKPVFKQF